MKSTQTRRPGTRHGGTHGRTRQALFLALIGGGLLLHAARAQEAAPAPPAAADAAAPAAASAEAAPEAGGSLQEIVITATRHKELLSKVPVSVSAFSQETLDLKGVKDFTDVAKYTPGVNIDTNGTNNISIRGISSSGGSGTTGIYIDDTPIQMRALGFNADDTLPKTFDLERVEVLRGPQGTLFGAGSEGGTVRYIMAQPNMHESSVYARSELAFTQGGAPSYEAGVAAGTALVDGVLGVRASVWFRHDGGWIDHIDPFTQQTVQKDSNYSNDVAVRLAAKWAVNDSLTITPSFLYQDRAVNDTTVFWSIYSLPGSDKYANAEPTQHPEPDHYFLPSLKIETELLGAALISNTSFFSRKDLSGYDGTEYNLSYYQTFNWSPTPFASQSYYPLIDGTGLHLPAGVQNYRAPATVHNQQQNFTQEFRLQSPDAENARLTWTTGLFFSTNRQTSVEEIHDPMMYQLFQGLFFGGAPATAAQLIANEQAVYLANGATVLEPLLPNGDSYYNYNFSRDKQIAIFGESSLAITQQLKAIAGFRYAKTDVNFTHFADGPQNFIGPNAGVGTESDKPFTPKLGLSFQADRDNLYYATYAKGYRIGGADPPIPTSACANDLAAFGIPAAPSSYNSDTVGSFELGTKNNFHDRLRVASSLYWIKWKNIQQNIYLPGCGFQFTANVGNAVAKGGDVQIDWAPNDAINVEAALGYTNARFTGNAALSASAATPVVASGDAVTGESGTPVSPWTLTVGGQYNFGTDRKSYIRVDWEVQTHNNTPTPAEDPATSQWAYGYAYTPATTTFASLRAGTQIDKHWSLAGFVDNLFDSHPNLPPSSYAYSDVDKYNPAFIASGNRVPGASSLIRNYTFRPRTIGVTATMHF